MSSGRLWMKTWPKGVPKSLEYPRKALFEIVKEAAQKAPHKVAIKFLGARLTYEELDELSSRFAKALQRQGVQKGDRVALYLPNTPQFVIAFFGILKAGAVVVPHNPLYRERELKFQLNDSGAVAVVAARDVVKGNELFAPLQNVRRETGLKHVITTSITDFLSPIKRLLAPLAGVKRGNYAGTLDFVGLLEASSPDYSQIEIDPLEDTAVILYTGGTTGTSKGAILTHLNFYANMLQAGSFLPIDPSRDVVLAVLPLFHSYGLTACMLMALYHQMPLVLLPRYDTLEVIKTIQREKVTIFPGVPTMYVAITNHPRVKQFNLNSVTACVSGAAALPAAVMQGFKEVTGGTLAEGYGLTEASPVTHVNPLIDPEKIRPGSIGLPLPDTEAKIVDLETGSRELQPEEVGELVVRGPQVMKGYWNRPEENALALQNGWLYTGDIAKMDAEGYFYIVDRKKDLIKVGAEQVWPRDVEEVLYMHPAVKEAAVIGVADQYKGEIPKAYVTLKPDYEGKIGEQEIIDFCKSKLASYKVPKYVEFRSQLPKNIIGKVLRKDLRENPPPAP